MRIGVDAQILAHAIKAGLYYHHLHLFREMRNYTDREITLFVNGWSAGRGIPEIEDLSASFPWLPVKSVRMPGTLQWLRLKMSPLGRMNVFYHVFGGTFGPIPTAANVYLVPDIIPLAVDYFSPDFREESQAYYDSAVNNGEVLFVYSEHTKADIVQRLGADASRIIVMPLAAGPEFAPVNNRNRLREFLVHKGIGENPYILTVSTVEPRKNFESLVRAFGRLKRMNRGCRHKLVFCGAKSLGFDKLMDTVAEEGVGDEVIFLGYGDHLELLYNGASLFVFPSTYEGFGLPPLEAMACGVPVVASNLTSVPEVVGDAGVLVDPLDINALCDAMNRVLEDRKLALRLRQSGLERAAKFSWKRTAELFIRGLDQAVKTSALKVYS